MIMRIVVAALGIFALATADSTVYLIRHGEKPPSGNGLSTQGMQRAQCLRDVFGASSGYDIGYIMAQDFKSSTTTPRLLRATSLTRTQVASVSVPMIPSYLCLKTLESALITTATAMIQTA